MGGGYGVHFHLDGSVGGEGFRINAGLGRREGGGEGKNGKEEKRVSKDVKDERRGKKTTIV